MSRIKELEVKILNRTSTRDEEVEYDRLKTYEDDTSQPPRSCNPVAVDELYARAGRESAADAGLTSGTDQALAYESGFVAGASYGASSEAQSHRDLAAALAAAEAERDEARAKYENEINHISKVCTVCGSTEHTGIYKCPIAIDRLKNAPNPEHSDNKKKFNDMFLKFSASSSEDKVMADCMMPDGAEPCLGYRQLQTTCDEVLVVLESAVEFSRKALADMIIGMEMSKEQKLKVLEAIL